MPLYESPKYAENRINLKVEWRDAVICGPDQVVAAILTGINAARAHLGRTVQLAFDGWYDIDWPSLVGALAQQADAAGVSLVFHSITTVFQPREVIEHYKRQFTETDDPGFGVVNRDGQIADLMDLAKVAALRDALTHATESDAIIVYGAGAAIPALCDDYDLRYYFDKTRQPILWEMWDGKLTPFGWAAPKADYGWKDYYYCDYYLLDRQKHFLLPRMDFWWRVSPLTA